MTAVSWINQTRSLAESKCELFILSALFISFIDWCLFSSQGCHAPVATIGQLQLASCSGQFLLCFACMNRSCPNEPVNYRNCFRCLVRPDSSEIEMSWHWIIVFIFDEWSHARLWGLWVQSDFVHWVRHQQCTPGHCADAEIHRQRLQLEASLLGWLQDVLNV